MCGVPLDDYCIVFYSLGVAVALLVACRFLFALAMVSLYTRWEKMLRYYTKKVEKVENNRGDLCCKFYNISVFCMQ